jgi:surface antigen
LIATLAAVVVSSKTPQPVDPIKLVHEIQVPTPNFETDVVLKLKELQPANEAKLRAAEEARRKARLEAISARMKPVGTYGGNSYSWGQCTAFVASRVRVPSFLGNANNWVYSLPRAGYREGQPIRGAIAVTQAGWAGHVALVEGVSGGLVHISEYNYIPYSYSERWVSVSEFRYFY